MSKPQRNKAHWLDRTLFLMPGHMALCLSEEAFKREMRKSDIPPAEWCTWISPNAKAVVHGFRSRDNELTCIVCMRKIRGEERSTVDTLLVHEAVHIWQQVRNEIGERSPSPEFEAYAIQNISKRLIDAYHAA